MNILALLVLNFVFLMIFCSIGGVGGDLLYESQFCSEHFNYLTNFSSGQYYMVHHEEPFNHACCADAGTASYTREPGTIGYFFGGSKGIYTVPSCDWLSDEQQEEYNPPNMFIGTFRFIWSYIQ